MVGKVATGEIDDLITEEWQERRRRGAGLHWRKGASGW